MLFRQTLAIVFLTLGLGSPAFSEDYANLKTYSAQGEFDEINENVEFAIINQGFKIDYRGYTGKMLKRTGKDVGSSKVIFKDAQFYQFCSANLSRKTMEADPRNIGFCPYIVFVYQLPSSPETVHVGYRQLPMMGSDASKQALMNVNKVLDEIAREATE